MNKLLSCRYNMDTNRVETRFKDGTTLAIDCIAPSECTVESIFSKFARIFRIA